MERLELLDLAAAAFCARAEAVGVDEWSRQTPCAEWDIGDLVDHVIGGNRFTALILGGATAESAMTEVMASFGSDDDRRSALRRSIDAQRVAFHAAGALDATCHHVTGDMSGSQVLGYRLTDLTLHSWDLAKATVDDDTIDEKLVASVWADMEQRRNTIDATGQFGDGPSGTLPENAPLQTRLLDLAGRRP
jgi:uncharacterized protein (TIGR03086 family)